MCIARVPVPVARRVGPLRIGVPQLVVYVTRPVPVAPVGRDRQTVDGCVPGWRGQAAARGVANGLDRDSQTAARVDDHQVDAAQGSLAAGLLVEWRDRSPEQRGPAHAHRARPELRHRYERRFSSGHAVPARRLPVVVQRDRRPVPVSEPAHPPAGRRGRRRRVAALRCPVRAQPSRARPVTVPTGHRRWHSAAYFARGRCRVHAPVARPIRLSVRDGRIARPPAQVYSPPAARHEAYAKSHHRGHQ